MHDGCRALDALAAFSAKFRVEDLYESRRLLQQALSIDPSYARSYSFLANAYGVTCANPAASEPERSPERLFDLTQLRVGCSKQPVTRSERRYLSDIVSEERQRLCVLLDHVMCKCQHEGSQGRVEGIEPHIGLDDVNGPL